MVSRCPTGGVAVAFAAGILWDAFLPLTWMSWVGVGILFCVGWLVALRIRQLRMALLLLLAGCVCLGAARHHGFRFVRAPDAIDRYVTEERRPVRLTGIVTAEPWIRPRKENSGPTAAQQFDRSSCDISCSAIATDDGVVRVSGLVRLSASGHLLHVHAGDEVEIRGWLSRQLPPGNPGEFDFREYPAGQGIAAVASVDTPDAVHRIGHSSGWWFRRAMDGLRDRAEVVLMEQVGERQLPVASAILLGDRSLMGDDVRNAFAESGAMHLLAISGLHVGIFAAMFWFACRLCGVSNRATATVVIAAVVSYACLTGGRPSVVRATIFVCIAALGHPWYRQVSMVNVLAVAALIVLVWRPTDLFDTGAQLSFLAVAGMMWSGSLGLFGNRDESPEDKPLPMDSPGLLGRSLRSAAGYVLRVYVTMAAIWLCTAPLVAARFHLASPIGFGINVFLIPFVTVVLWLGYALLFVGLVMPALAMPFAWAFNGCLGVMLGIVDVAADWSLEHFYLPGPQMWWLLLYYAIMAALLIAGVRQRARRVMGMALGSCVLIGLAIGLMPRSSDTLRCTFLAVGHGGAILVEFPNGRTLLYDGGSISSPDRPARAVANALWHRGRWRLDAVVVSHADIDHFNGIPTLLERVPVGVVIASPTLFDFRQQAVSEFCDSLATADVPIRTCFAGDRLVFDRDVSVRVLHPRASEHFETDNENSVVLVIEYGHRTILLTGNLEDDGLREVLDRLPAQVDVLQSPHHGSLDANTAELAQRTQPTTVVVSSGRAAAMAKLKERYGDRVEILSTFDHGAVTVEIEASGQMRTSWHRREQATSRQLTAREP
jgi:competence protein ComEC